MKKYFWNCWAEKSQGQNNMCSIPLMYKNPQRKTLKFSMKMEEEKKNERKSKSVEREEENLG